MLRLPQHPEQHLKNSPLVLAAAQVNFTDTGDVSRADAREIQVALGRDDWSEVQANRVVTQLVLPGAITPQSSRLSWSVAPRDRRRGVSLNPDSASLEISDYDGWEALSQTLRTLLLAVQNVIGPTQSMRLGLRYINQIPLPADAESWDGLIPNLILGPAARDSVLSDGVDATEQRIVLDFGEGVRSLFRHGQIKNAGGSSQYLLDYDVFFEGARPFDVDGLMKTADRLHDQTWQLFRSTVTDDLFQRFAKGEAS